MRYINLDHKAVDILLSDSKLILEDVNNPKVYQLCDKTFLKIFKLKKLFSSGLFCHYANRFINNSFELKQLGITTVDIINQYNLPKDFINNKKLIKAVQYQPIEGITLRELIQSGNMPNNFIDDLARFFAKLHDLGIYFRAGHFANIIYNPDFADKFGLIDIDNIRFYNKKLDIKLRCKNFKEHILRYDIDKKWFINNKQNILNKYCKYSNIYLNLF